ncbi:MAG: hypothetical protein RL596_537 [Bacteroidota bacterium]|jgi:signal transduction histidine kinase
MGMSNKRVLSIFDYGTQFTNNKDKQDRIRAINWIFIISFPIILFLLILNIVTGRYILAMSNFYIFLVGIVTILINPFPKYDTYKLILNITLSIIFTFQVWGYHNGSEYFHIQNLILIFIFFDDKRFIISSTIPSILGFVLCKYLLLLPPLFEPMPASRVLFNIGWFLSVIALGLVYFKRTQINNQQYLKEKNEKLAIANQTKEKLFSIIAHDLRSPIAQLKGSLNLLSHEYISKEEFLELTVSFNKQVDQLENNLNNLLSWSQRQLSGIAPIQVSFSVKDVLDEAISFLKENLNRKQINIAVDIRATNVYMDPDHLRLVFRNLLSNAIKFSNRASTIYVSDQIYDEKLFISIRDEGIGISEEKLLTLFSGELNISERGTELEKGNGLGLNLCREFLQLNNASIWVTSAKNNGSTFTISIPLAK